MSIKKDLEGLAAELDFFETVLPLENNTDKANAHLEAVERWVADMKIAAESLSIRRGLDEAGLKRLVELKNENNALRSALEEARGEIRELERDAEIKKAWQDPNVSFDEIAALSHKGEEGETVARCKYCDGDGTVPQHPDGQEGTCLDCDGTGEATNTPAVRNRICRVCGKKKFLYEMEQKEVCTKCYHAPSPPGTYPPISEEDDKVVREMIRRAGKSPCDSYAPTDNLPDAICYRCGHRAEMHTVTPERPPLCATCGGTGEIYPGPCPRCGGKLIEMATCLWCEPCATEFPKKKRPCPSCKGGKERKANDKSIE